MKRRETNSQDGTVVWALRDDNTNPELQPVKMSSRRRWSRRRGGESSVWWFSAEGTEATIGPVDFPENVAKTWQKASQDLSGRMTNPSHSSTPLLVILVGTDSARRNWENMAKDASLTQKNEGLGAQVMFSTLLPLESNRFRNERHI